MTFIFLYIIIILLSITIILAFLLKNFLIKYVVLMNTVIIIIIVLLFIFIMEMYFGVFNIQTDSFVLAKSSVRFSKLYHHKRDVNSISYSKANIIILGDSFVYGYGIKDKSETFPYLLDKNTDYNVVSLARPGDNIDNYLEKIRHLPDSIPVELIILGFCYNDIGDSVVNRRIYDYIKPVHWYKKILVEHSFFFSRLYYRFQLTRPEVSKFYTEKLIAKYNNPKTLKPFINRVALIKQEALRKFNADLILIEYPLIALNEHELYKEARHSVLSQFDSLNIRRIDITDEISEFDISELTVNSMDQHPSPKMNSIVTNKLLDIIQI